jgi:hypothetical protein
MNDIIVNYPSTGMCNAASYLGYPPPASAAVSKLIAIEIQEMNEAGLISLSVFMLTGWLSMLSLTSSDDN